MLLHPEWVAARGKARRAKKLAKQVAPQLTLEQWEQIQIEWNYQCAYCNLQKPLTQDHLIPLSKGGQHTYDNILPACESCNKKKGSLDADEFLRRRLEL